MDISRRKFMKVLGLGGVLVPTGAVAASAVLTKLSVKPNVVDKPDVMRLDFIGMFEQYVDQLERCNPLRSIKHYELLSHKGDGRVEVWGHVFCGLSLGTTDNKKIDTGKYWRYVIDDIDSFTWGRMIAHCKDMTRQLETVRRGNKERFEWVDVWRRNAKEGDRVLYY